MRNRDAALLSEKPRLGEKVRRRQRLWRSRKLSHGMHWRKRRAYGGPSYGRTVYNYFRDYDPATGKYIQSDPIGLAGGLNTYLYANANPLRFIDPLGLRPTVNPKGPDGRPIEHDCQKMCIVDAIGSSMLAAATGYGIGALVSQAGLGVASGTLAAATVHTGSSGVSGYSFFSLAECLEKCEEEENCE